MEKGMGHELETELITFLSIARPKSVHTSICRPNIQSSKVKSSPLRK